ncbi:MAG: lytic transglycosylase domain-containing protein [Nitrospinae bacterium]|nr:lytic transglycosylase domain-containing protein [Nitrospinota bacterium]MZH15653.1 lytic transglycosylase domain-containing protein [Nitrospinota bacterium]
MVLNKTTKNLTPVLLIIAFTGFFTGKTPDYVSGLSPFFSDLARVEAVVFSKAKVARLEQEQDYDDRVRDRIEKVISKYYTGLDEKNDVRIPEWILVESKKYGYDPLFLTALIITESSFYNWAKSNRGARGLMQLRPATAVALASETRLKWRGTRTLFDPEKNIALGAYYLNKLVSRFGDLTLALEAYNHGPSRLSRYLRKGYQPKRYSKKVLKNYRKIRFQPI